MHSILDHFGSDFIWMFRQEKEREKKKQAKLNYEQQNVNSLLHSCDRSVDSMPKRAVFKPFSDFTLTFKQTLLSQDENKNWCRQLRIQK